MSDSTDQLCSWCTHVSAKFRCTRCRDASPPTVYCGTACQKQDWTFHKEYCGKTAYTFELTLVDSSNPVITRTFDVPSWFTFRQLHYVIQYGMEWQGYHLHEFSFAPQPTKPGSWLSPFTEVLRIGPESLFDDEDGPIFPQTGTMRRTPPKQEYEETLLLQDVFGTEGRLRDVVAPRGEVFPLYYLYDFGDCWEHELIFKGAKPARAARPLFSAATGCGPVEDSGAIHGWEAVKSVFRAPNPTRDQRERQDWARNVSGLGYGFDPFKKPDVVQMNYEARWENHLENFMSGEDEEWDEEGYEDNTF